MCSGGAAGMHKGLLPGPASCSGRFAPASSATWGVPCARKGNQCLEKANQSSAAAFYSRSSHNVLGSCRGAFAASAGATSCRAWGRQSIVAEVHGREAACDCRRTPQLWVLDLQLRPHLLHTPCSTDSMHAKMRGGVRAACRTATQEAARRKLRRRPLRTACLAAPQAAGLRAGAATLGESACTAACTDSSSAQQPSGNPRPRTAQPSVDSGAATLGRSTGDGSCAQQPSSLGPHAAQPPLVNGTAGPRRLAGAEHLLSANSCAPAQQPSSPDPHAVPSLLDNGQALASRSPGGERPHAADTEAQPSECAPFDLCTPCIAVYFGSNLLARFTAPGDEQVQAVQACAAYGGQRQVPRGRGRAHAGAGRTRRPARGGAAGAAEDRGAGIRGGGCGGRLWRRAVPAGRAEPNSGLVAPPNALVAALAHVRRQLLRAGQPGEGPRSCVKSGAHV